MLGDLELKNDDWVKAKETFRSAKDSSDGKDSYPDVCLVNTTFKPVATFSWFLYNITVI